MLLSFASGSPSAVTGMNKRPPSFFSIIKTQRGYDIGIKFYLSVPSLPGKTSFLKSSLGKEEHPNALKGVHLFHF